MALVVVLAGTTIYLAVSKNAYAQSANQPVPAQSMAGKIPATTNQQATNNQESIYNPQNLDIKSLNGEWNIYTSKKFGFSINIPKRIYKGEAELGTGKNCTGYRPVTAFEDDSRIFIVSDYGITPGFAEDKCVKQVLKDLKSNSKEGENIDGFVLNAFSAPAENDLTKIADQMYGCKTTISKKLSSQPGTYDVHIEPMETCVMNFTYFFKYSPTLKKAIVWNMDQNWNMLKGPRKEDAEENESYDLEMARSFRFLDK